MQVIGHATELHLWALSAHGIPPEKVPEVLLAEAERRHPDAKMIMANSNIHGISLDIVATF